MFGAIASFFSSAWPYIVAVIAFLFLIVVHEFGHFIAAKSLGVRVNEFAVGFGPRIFHKKGKETEYSLRLVPLGGFCAMEGEDEESTDEKAFCRKPAWRRFLIVVMGAVFNILFGVLLIGITLLPQSVYATTTVSKFTETAVSNQAGGLQAGDRIVEVEGRHIFTQYDLAYNFSAVEDGNLNMKVVRDGKTVTLNEVPFATQKLEGYNVIQLDFFVYGQKRTVGSFLAETGKTALSYSRIVVFSLIDMLSGRYHISDISGPVGVTAALGEAAQSGVLDLLPMIALITINLGIFNLLPVPALDGGRLVFILIEMIFRKPVPQKYESWVHAAGMAVLLLFMAVITVKDIWVRIF